MMNDSGFQSASGPQMEITVFPKFLFCISALHKGLNCLRVPVHHTICWRFSVKIFKNSDKLAICRVGTQQSNLAASEWPRGFASFHLIRLYNRLLEVPPGSLFTLGRGFCESWFQCPFMLLTFKRDAVQSESVTKMASVTAL